MAIGISVSTSSTTFQHKHNPFLRSKPTSIIIPTSLFHPSIQKFSKILQCKTKPKPRRTVCLVVDDQKSNIGGDVGISAARLAEKSATKKSERLTYLAAAVMSSFGFTSMAVLSVYYRFSWQVEGGEVSYAEMFGTFGLSIGAAVGMEFWARWAHRALWHASMWHVHESHHRPREGPFELNDVIAMINAIPAIVLFNFGFFHRGLIPDLCFGAGLGITVFGIAYMFVHDGLVHKRFPVGPIANVPYLRRVAAAHQLHHSDKFNGVPYGLFLGPQEVEGIGGIEELEKEVNRRSKFSKRK